MQVERRRHPRFKVNDNAFAVLNPEPVRLVPILDIGLGGIGIYLNDQNQWPDNASKLEIMVADCSFYLENIPFEAISNFKALPANVSKLPGGRRCSLIFGSLSPSQKSELKYFIRSYTQGGAFRQVMQRFSKVLHPFREHNHSGPSCNTRIWQNLHRPSV